MQKDWALFAPGVLDIEDLTIAVLPVVSGLRFLPMLSDTGEPLESWDKLRDQLRMTNRFFPEPAPDKKLMQDLTGLLVIDQEDVSEPFFRARIRRHERRFSMKDMGSPPAEVASPGRANPVGIPYLYLASDAATAVAEVRPSVADVVCVARFAPTRKFKLVDLVSPRSSISPFRVDADSLERVRSSMAFVEALSSELRTPTPPHRASSDYLATQYLCELVKNLGYDGVRYGSALGAGTNFAIFTPGLFAGTGRVVEHEISDIQVEMRVRR